MSAVRHSVRDGERLACHRDEPRDPMPHRDATRTELLRIWCRGDLHRQILAVLVHKEERAIRGGDDMDGGPDDHLQ